MIDLMRQAAFRMQKELRVFWTQQLKENFREESLHLNSSKIFKIVKMMKTKCWWMVKKD